MSYQAEPFNILRDTATGALSKGLEIYLEAQSEKLTRKGATVPANVGAVEQQPAPTPAPTPEAAVAQVTEQQSGPALPPGTIGVVLVGILFFVILTAPAGRVKK